MQTTPNTSAHRGGIVVEHDDAIAGPCCLDDALMGLARIAAELLLDLNTREVVLVAA
jgi:hypothetical protein